MANHESQVDFLGYELLKFQFERGSSEKRGWSFYPEIQVVPGEGYLQGKVRLSASAFFEKDQGKPFAISVLLEGLFQSKHLSREEFEQYCLVKGAARLVPVLQKLVNDFLEITRNVLNHAP